MLDIFVLRIGVLLGEEQSLASIELLSCSQSKRRPDLQTKQF
jgi:hypothetical protein